ncbi:hypothetical protein R3P38DRAFT_3415404 [Favolaschia claudopus]|uniref:Uncharacterized protein n=1 Tax=Favolaschia claudopus TaxID=2862362 RepID=A0AAW0EG83_9AGAR
MASGGAPNGLERRDFEKVGSGRRGSGNTNVNLRPDISENRQGYERHSVRRHGSATKTPLGIIPSATSRRKIGDEGQHGVGGYTRRGGGLVRLECQCGQHGERKNAKLDQRGSIHAGKPTYRDLRTVTEMTIDIIAAASADTLEQRSFKKVESGRGLGNTNVILRLDISENRQGYERHNARRHDSATETPLGIIRSATSRRKIGDEGQHGSAGTRASKTGKMKADSEKWKDCSQSRCPCIRMIQTCRVSVRPAWRAEERELDKRSSMHAGKPTCGYRRSVTRARADDRGSRRSGVGGYVCQCPAPRVEVVGDTTQRRHSYVAREDMRGAANEDLECRMGAGSEKRKGTLTVKVDRCLTELGADNAHQGKQSIIQLGCGHVDQTTRRPQKKSKTDSLSSCNSRQWNPFHILYTDPPAIRTTGSAVTRHSADVNADVLVKTCNG